MQIEFLLGPAGSGKTFRCVREARDALEKSADGPLLIFLVPKQATFQLERLLLQDSTLAGYTRLKILSFERLAEFVLDHFETPPPRLLSEEGRIMVLRALLAKKEKELQLFRGSSRLPGFARQLSGLLRELKQNQITGKRLKVLAGEVGNSDRIHQNLHDLALMAETYQEWLATHALGDADELLDLATGILLRQAPQPSVTSSLRIQALWMDGFAQLTAQERRLLCALAPFAEQSTLAFCVDVETTSSTIWFSPWTVVKEAYSVLQANLAQLPHCKIRETHLERRSENSRFSTSPMLQHLERHWNEPVEYTELQKPAAGMGALRVVSCPNPEAEATLAAKEILKFVRGGGRYREAAVLVRQLDQYHGALKRAFAKYGIPCFLDRREPVAHHPMAELTRGALRTVIFQWRHLDWFTVLKSGLVHDSDERIDWLENEALARGWEGDDWEAELRWTGKKPRDPTLEPLRKKLTKPFLNLKGKLGPKPSGAQLVQALRGMWVELGVEETLDRWTDAEDLNEESLHGVHGTVWDQMNDWLDNVALAFSQEALPLIEWLPILEAGLSSLSIGVVPPVLDQVLIGAVDRSRNPDLQRVYLLGMNETVFPALTPTANLLSEADRAILEKHGCELGLSTRRQAAQERFLGYIGCTRARSGVLLTYASRNHEGKALNPSSFISHLGRMFPGLSQHEKFNAAGTWSESEHLSEVLPFLLQVQGAKARLGSELASIISSEALSQLRSIAKLPSLESALIRLKHLHASAKEEKLEPGMAERLYGPELKTSVSQFEQFAACPFRFFVSSGLQAEERLKFELDARQQGSFQHEVLAKFHDKLRTKKLRWRDLTPEEGAKEIGTIAEAMMGSFEGGLLEASEENRFLGRSHKKALQKLMETLLRWMTQYEFDPTVVEIGFGFENELPAWQVQLGNGRSLLFRGRIDRVDLWSIPGSDEALCVVIDYKSSLRKLEPLYLSHGLHQQLPAYLNVLRQLKSPKHIFGVSRLIPAGVFYVNLSGAYDSGKNRKDVLLEKSEGNSKAYCHEGLLNANELSKLDNRGVSKGDQFKYSLTKSGALHKRCRSALPQAAFETMLDEAEKILRDLGTRVYEGDVRVDPYKHGADLACGKCTYQSICRIDPWTHTYRSLSEREANDDELDQ
ncbi:MAG TPA: PD-(D/E)XK nuclease family protein [Candidatus Saccharimonadales bacterium]|nr:PD-(D/E)XK nuclease family protein [Candidatus Saccharimonadales bacterium]